MKRESILQGVSLLREKSVTPGTSRGPVALGSTVGTATLPLTSSVSSPYLLVLALAATAVIAVLVLYLIVRHWREALADGQTNTTVG